MDFFISDGRSKIHNRCYWIPCEFDWLLWARNHRDGTASSSPRSKVICKGAHERCKEVITKWTWQPSPKAQPLLHNSGFFTVALQPHLMMDKHHAIPSTVSRQGEFKNDSSVVMIIQIQLFPLINRSIDEIISSTIHPQHALDVIQYTPLHGVSWCSLVENVEQNRSATSCTNFPELHHW